LGPHSFMIKKGQKPGERETPEPAKLMRGGRRRGGGGGVWGEHYATGNGGKDTRLLFMWDRDRWGKNRAHGRGEKEKLYSSKKTLEREKDSFSA